MNKTEKRRWWTRVLLGASGLVVLVGCIALLAVSSYIGRQVRVTGESAKQRHTGDAVEALLACAEDSSLSLKERNRAIWALGQLGDRRALSVLRAHQTGQPCDHVNRPCERELDKAIALLDGGVNVTAWVWREQASR